MAKVLFRPIRARAKRSDFNLIVRPVYTAIDEVVKPELIQKHEKIVEDWTIDVTFGALKRIDEKGISVYVYPKGDDKDIYAYVTKGTPPHDITPKKPGGALRFKWNGPGSYRPVSAPFKGPLRLAGGIEATDFVHFKKVKHPGIEPRYFEKKIAEEYKPRFNSVVEAAFKRGIRAANKAAAA